MKFTIKEYEVVTKNNGNAKEWTLCEYYGIHRRKPDRTPYHKGSDIELGYMNISVKTPSASLMSGSLCVGCKPLKEIGGGIVKILILILSRLSQMTLTLSLWTSTSFQNSFISLGILIEKAKRMVAASKLSFIVKAKK